MTVAKVFSVAPIGFESHLIEVESDSSKGLPSFQIVGMGNKAIDEARERVRSAINNSLLEFPTKRLTINLAPAELSKDGTHYDLPIALTILVNNAQLKQSEVNGGVFAGELALDGTLRPIRGCISIAEAARKHGFDTVYLPAQNAKQASLVQGIKIIPCDSLKDLFLHLKHEKQISPYPMSLRPDFTDARKYPALIDDIYGQEQAKRAMIIAAAGRHNILLSGPPGAGKTMLAKTLASLLPDLSSDELLAVTKLYSLAGEQLDKIIHTRPFRAPHHTSSRTSLVGGGAHPKPGDISLAHLGVLFLDEMPEYPIATLEALRQPLEDKRITISRAKSSATYPADFMLVGTMNPCPCGFYGDSERECTCTSTQVLSYQKRLSGPLIDRIDMVINVSRVPNSALLRPKVSSDSQHKNALRIIGTALNMQRSRYKRSDTYNNSITNKNLQECAHLSPQAITLLDTATDRLKLTARSYFKILKVARTIADLAASPEILPSHLSEALQYRQTS